MPDLVVVDGKARGSVTRDVADRRDRSRTSADVVVLATAATERFTPTNAKASNCTAYGGASPGRALGNRASRRSIRRGHPQSASTSRTELMSGVAAERRRVWVPKKKDRHAPAERHPRWRPRLLSRRRYPSSATSCPRRRLTGRQGGLRRGSGSGRAAPAYTSNSPTPSPARPEDVRAKYGTLRITSVSRRRRVPRADRTTAPPLTPWAASGSIPLMSPFRGLSSPAKANFSDQGANRLGANALMQGLPTAIHLPATVPDYVAAAALRQGDPSHPASVKRGRRPPAHTRVAQRATAGGRSIRSTAIRPSMWDECGMARSDAGLRRRSRRFRSCGKESRERPRARHRGGVNQSSRKAGRVPNFLELADWNVHRTRSTGRSLRATSASRAQDTDGEARRETPLLHRGVGVDGLRPSTDAPQGTAPVEHVHLTQRSYK